MPEFIFAYHGGKPPENDADIEKVMAEWQAWFEGIGPGVVIPGNPVGMSRTVSADGVADNGGPNPISGYTVISAADMDAATEIAKGCPMVKDGSGSVELAEIHQM